MKITDWEYIPAGMIELRNSPGVQGFLLQVAKDVEATAGGGPYRTDVRPGKTRAHARVSTIDGAGYGREIHANYLLKALGGAGSPPGSKTKGKGKGKGKGPVRRNKKTKKQG